jgi:bifunctional DNA-binding transcriptional regulator/antitoxin component of YhaV-PrlF toxin-antitoxin module
MAFIRNLAGWCRISRSDCMPLHICGRDDLAGWLAKGLGMWHKIPMNATLSLDEAGRLVLPNTALRVLGIKPGDQVRADVSPNRIDICPEPPVMAQGMIESGVLMMARQGVRMDAAAAVRSDRDSRADRALPR